MHEQHDETVKHDSSSDMNEVKTPNRPPTRMETINAIAEPMRDFALQNPCRTHIQNYDAVVSGKFARLVKIKQTVNIFVIVTVAPNDAETELFWHCSMSLCSSMSGNQKSVTLWTRREHMMIRRLLKDFLHGVGIAGTEVFNRTKSAIHCGKKLTYLEKVEL